MLVKMVRGEDKCVCEEAQVKVYEDLGFTREGAEKKPAKKATKKAAKKKKAE